MRFTTDGALVGVRALVYETLAIAALAAAGMLLALSLCLPAAEASSSCPNEIFRTGPGASLPDCRAYEMVSPPNKNGGEVEGGPVNEGVAPAPEQAALDGEAVTYASETTFTEANPLSSMVVTQYLSKRSPAGWQTQAITPEQDLPGGTLDTNVAVLEFSLFQGFNEDLSDGFLAAGEPAPVAGAPAKFYSPYVRDDANGSYRLLSTVTPPTVHPGAPDPDSGGFGLEYAGMSTDGSDVAFAANDALTPSALPGQNNLYESVDGRLELVSVLPNGKTAGNAEFGSFSKDQAGLFENYKHVISSDGSRIIWTNVENEEYGDWQYQLYMRELTPEGPRTVNVSASQKTNGSGPGGTDPEGPRPAVYATASADDSKIFFTSCEKLTNDSTAGAGAYYGAYFGCGQFHQYFQERKGEDLYVYDANTGRLSDLTVDPTPGQTANVIGVLGASEDGSYVYFVASGVLAPGASAGAYNIYVWHDGVTSLVAADSSSDYSAMGIDGAFQDSQYLMEVPSTRVSPDGRYLAFESTEPLTGYDSTPAQAGTCQEITSFWAESFENHTGHCIEVYEYDADAGKLKCVSCNPAGLPPIGNSIVPLALHSLIYRPGWQTSTVEQRYLLDDGRLFFDSTDAISPLASNGKLNVFEYEPSGVGGCEREGGCVSLISSGTSSENSYFMDASASGSDVFLITRQQLVAQDGDEALDVYDARVDGGFSAATPPPCSGEACRPPVTPAPAIYGAPASAAFVGAGNPPAPLAKVTVGKAKKSHVKKKSKTKRRSSGQRHAAKRGADGHLRVRGAGARRSSQGGQR